MADVEKVARAICRADRQDPDRLIHYRDIQVSSTREPYPAWRNYIKQAEAALAAMGEREAVLSGYGEYTPVTVRAGTVASPRPEAVGDQRERFARIADAECLVADDASAREAARSIAANIRVEGPA